MSTFDVVVVFGPSNLARNAIIGNDSSLLAAAASQRSLAWPAPGRGPAGAVRQPRVTGSFGQSSRDGRRQRSA